MATRKEHLQREIQTLRAEWEQERKGSEVELEERDAVEGKGGARGKEGDL